MRNEPLTASVVERQYIDLCRTAFRRLRDKHKIGFDSDLARLLGWPSTYTQYLSGARPMPIKELCQLAAFGQCNVLELLALGEREMEASENA